MLFVDNCSGPVLQMIGTRYNVEPFYFSSTIGWTPCRFQSNVVSNISDRQYKSFLFFPFPDDYTLDLTVVFTFIRSVHSDTIAPTASLNSSYEGSVNTSHTSKRAEFTVDTQAPLVLRSST